MKSNLAIATAVILILLPPTILWVGCATVPPAYCSDVASLRGPDGRTWYAQYRVFENDSHYLVHGPAAAMFRVETAEMDALIRQGTLTPAAGQ